MFHHTTELEERWRDGIFDASLIEHFIKSRLMVQNIPSQDSSNCERKSQASIYLESQEHISNLFVSLEFRDLCQQFFL